MYDNNQRPRSCAFALAAGLIGMLTSAGMEAATVETGGPIDKVAVVSETVGNIYAPGGSNPVPGVFVSLPGATVSLTVPPGTSRLFVATYSAESTCYGGGVEDHCSVRILIGGVEGNPAAGSEFAFDSTDAGVETTRSWESHSMQRWRRITNPGQTPLTVQIRVQRTTTSPATSLRLDDWQLTVLRSE